VPRRITSWQAEGHEVITGRAGGVPLDDKPAGLAGRPGLAILAA
jgi:hypothetical protein